LRERLLRGVLRASRLGVDRGPGSKHLAITMGVDGQAVVLMIGARLITLIGVGVLVMFRVKVKRGFIVHKLPPSIRYQGRAVLCRGRLL
jgi:hypothetical protein